MIIETFLGLVILLLILISSLGIGIFIRELFFKQPVEDIEDFIDSLVIGLVSILIFGTILIMCFQIGNAILNPGALG